jgi:hypothetical protein
MPGRRISERHADKPIVRTGGEVFPDGSMMELVRKSGGELQLLFWNGKVAKTAKQFVRHDETFVPLRIDPLVLRSLHLPNNIAEYRSTRQLFGEISELISRVTRFGDAVARTFTFLPFASWLTDSLPCAPFLWVVKPPTTTAAPLLQVLQLLCRRALIVNDISLASFHSLPMELQPMLLTEVFDPTRRELKLLRASTRRGVLSAAHGKTADFYCAKIVFAPEPLRDRASAGFPLELVLPSTREYVALLSSSEAERIASEYQSKLLLYRLMNRAKVRTPAFDLNQFTPTHVGRR